ncbi:MAG: hypothetical protein KZQ90_20790 [Candidatus Thiodiazotropha sp. (ex Codakia rugifera)]|nr:hypothetical protein [Candidatus Thiodiazotropha sp. (ex Codakia rugifera)]
MSQENSTDAKDKLLKHMWSIVDRMQQHNKWIDQPNHPELPMILDQYLKRDFWRLQEALNLIRGYHPSRNGWGKRGDLTLAKSCVGPGGSLSVINSQESDWDWKVRPKAFVKWAEEKGLSLHPDMKHAMISPARLSNPTPQTRTKQANRTRKAEKEARLEALVWMRNEIDQRTHDRNWDSSSIPSTKDDFHDVFYRIFPDIVEVKAETLAGDLPQIGIKFQPGRKTSKNNVLSKLFNDLI